MIMILVLIVALGKVDASMMVMKNIFAGCKENSGRFPAAYPPTSPCNNQLTNDAIMSPATECSTKESDINISNIKHHTFRPYKTQSSMFKASPWKTAGWLSQVLLSLPTKPNRRPAPNLGRQFVPASFPHARISLPPMKWWRLGVRER